MVKLRNWRTYTILCFIDCVQRFNQLALFVIPLQAILTIAKGKLSKRLQDLIGGIDKLNLPIPNDQNLYQYFFTVTVIALFSWLIVGQFRNTFLLRIKKRALHRIKNSNIQYSINQITREFREIDRFCKLIGQIIFSSILVILIYLFDSQLFLIIMLGVLSYAFLYRNFILKKGSIITIIFI